MTDSAPNFHIGPVPVYGDVILSPMDGYSDMPFRSLARRLGSAMSYTEFVSCIYFLHGRSDTLRSLSYEEWERPVVFQIYDDDPDRMLEAALRLQEKGPDIIDINMGCSAKAVVARGAGAGLMRTPEKIAAIFAKLANALEIPVTGKMRLGWDEDSRNYLEAAKIIEDNGGQLVALHARTKIQGSRGPADWDAIAELKSALSIPVIGNGGIERAEDIQKMKAYTGCDGVMAARAAIGNPWIFAGLEREEVSIEQVREMVLAHLEAMLSFYGPELGLTRFRKHAKAYISPYPLRGELRKQLLESQTPQQFIDLLDQIIKHQEVS